MNSVRKHWRLSLVIFLSLSIGILAVLPYLTFDRANFAPVFEGRFELGGEFWLYMHIICGGVALLSGGFQFWPWLRNRRPHIHRFLGRLYYFGGIFPSSIGGLVVAQGTVAGLTGQIGFSLLAIAWFVSGVLALRAIMRGDVQTHRAWMYRNFALTFGAVLLRLWLGVLIAPQVMSGVDADMAFLQAYQTVAWLAWVPNLWVAEWLIQRENPRRAAAMRLQEQTV
jgi:uncharacterized membrane protein